MTFAITRPVSDSLTQCELTHLSRKPIDLDRAREQHAAYESALISQGMKILRAPAAHDLPDAVFVEDTAIILNNEIAIITRPGAASRRPEIPAIAELLAPLRKLTYITQPATLDGGDVLLINRHLFVGLSSRSNPQAIVQLQTAVAPQGYQVSSIKLKGCLHLKSAVTLVAPNLLLLNPNWVNPADFGNINHLAIDPREPTAANALLINNTLIFPEHFPHTKGRLESHGLNVLSVPCDELAKAEGAVTCCSLIVP